MLNSVTVFVSTGARRESKLCSVPVILDVFMVSDMSAPGRCLIVVAAIFAGKAMNPVTDAVSGGTTIARFTGDAPGTCGVGTSAVLSRVMHLEEESVLFQTAAVLEYT